MPRTTVAATTLALLAIIATGCSGDPMPTPTPSASPTTSTAPQGPYGDGELRIGTLVPISGPDAALARAQVAGVELAVRDINEAGGVNGTPVTVYHRNAGDITTQEPEAAITQLINHSVDVIIGPPTIDHAHRLATLATDTGTLLITPAINDPAARALATSGLYASTLPSAIHDGAGIAAQLPPRARVAIIYFSDSTGRGIRDSLATALPAAGANLVATITLTPSMRNPDPITTTLTSTNADTVIYAGSTNRTDQNNTMLTALAATEHLHSLWLASSALTGHTLPAGQLEGTLTVTPGGTPDPHFDTRIRSADPRATSTRGAAEAYDAVILAALAATIADDDGGRAIANHLADTSAHGIPCHSYAHCLHVLNTSDAWNNDIDYQGRSGTLDLDSTHTAQPSHYTVNRLDKTNTPQPTP